MQRWALILSAYQYDIKCISGKLNQCADCISHLPIVSKHDSAEEILSVMEINTVPIKANQIAKATTSNQTLSTVVTAVLHGQWPSKSTATLLLYCRRRNESTVMDGCLLGGRRVIIPQKFRKMLLAGLHVNHIGMSRMKALFRNYIW